jgi:hypothetical protein
VEGVIADRESGNREVSDSLSRKYRFPDGEIPNKEQGKPWASDHRDSGIYKTRFREFRTRDHARSNFPIR